MKVLAYSKTGAKKETGANLPTAVFGVEPNHEIIRQAYNAYLSNGRGAGAKTLTRGLVRGGGRKPWRQKGTGRARAGSSRIPHWRGGGVVFGPTGIENYEVKLPTKLKRLAIRQALSLQADSKKIIVWESFDGGEGKVTSAAALLSKLGVEGQILLVVPQKTDMIRRSTGNLAGVEVIEAKYLNVFSIINADCIVLVGESQAVINDWLNSTSGQSKPKSPAKPAAKAKAEVKS